VSGYKKRRQRKNKPSNLNGAADQTAAAKNVKKCANQPFNRFPAQKMTYQRRTRDMSSRQGVH
jgi:hypothetical protein